MTSLDVAVAAAIRSGYRHQRRLEIDGLFKEFPRPMRRLFWRRYWEKIGAELTAAVRVIISEEDPSYSVPTSPHIGAIAKHNPGGWPR